MREALDLSKEIIQPWAAAHSASFPPVVVHFTDGESTDGDPSEAAQALQAVKTNDGNAILVNGHISSRGGVEIVFPSQDEGLPDQFARTLFAMSSTLPAGMLREAVSLGYAATEASKAFVYNARAEHVVGMLEIGTRASNLR